MKILKTFEIFVDKDNVDLYKSMLTNYKFKIGDYIRLKEYEYDVEPYYKVIVIDMTDQRRPYLIRRGNEFGSEFWADGFPYEIISDEDFASIKYNI